MKRSMPLTDDHKMYARSPFHLIMLGGALGVLAIKSHYVVNILALAIYAAGWEVIPSMAFFRRWANRRKQKQQRGARLGVRPERQKSFDQLDAAAKERYLTLMHTAREIEMQVHVLYDGKDDHQAFLHLHQIDKLMSLYIQLLEIEILQRGETSGTLTLERDSLLADVETLKQDVANTEQGGDVLTAKSKTLASKLERLALLEQRLAYASDTNSDREYTEAELQRIEELMAVLHTDLLPKYNAEQFSVHIDVAEEQIKRATRQLGTGEVDVQPASVRMGFEVVK
jgi:hypothetical protein